METDFWNSASIEITFYLDAEILLWIFFFFLLFDEVLLKASKKD